MTGDKVVIQKRFGTITLDADEVDRIEYGRTPWEEFQERRAGVERKGEGPSKVDALYELATWAAENNLGSEARKIYQEILTRDPGHAGANKGLGREEVAGVWMSREEAMKARGYVRHPHDKARWISKEEKARIDRRSELLLLLRELPGAEDRTEIGEKIASYPPEDRLWAFIKGSSSSDPLIRWFSVYELVRLDDPLTTEALVRRLLYDPDKSIRQWSAEGLMRIVERHPDAVEPLVDDLVGKLGGADPLQTMRAANALAYWPNRRAMGALIDALERTLNPDRYRPPPRKGRIKIGGVKRHEEIDRDMPWDLNIFRSETPDGNDTDYDFDSDPFYITPDSVQIAPSGDLTDRGTSGPGEFFDERRDGPFLGDEGLSRSGVQDLWVSATPDDFGNVLMESERAAILSALRGVSGGIDFGLDVGRWRVLDERILLPEEE